MANMHFYYQDKLHRMNFQKVTDEPVRRSIAGPATAAARADGTQLYSEVRNVLRDKKQSKRLSLRFHGACDEIMCGTAGNILVVPTESVALGGVKLSEKNLIRDKFGLEEVQEGMRGNWLLRVPEGGEAGIRMAFEAAQFAYERGNVESASPNMLSLVPNSPPSDGNGERRSWGLDNPGDPGEIGADVHAPAAWTITQGDEEIKVAVLDEGVDSLHPWLKDAIVDELDIVDENQHARPDGDDAHGTACAGVVASRHETTSGLAPKTSLVGIRIAKRDSSGRWTVFDNMDTTDAILWAVDEAKVDILSNSWVCPPSDLISSAIAHALENGRSKRGCVVCFAAGNNQGPVAFPGTVEGVLTVGASNQWDKRKTTTSQDGESFWGSNHGPELDLLAPGVAITTTDIHGSKGMSPSLRTDQFNGTSAATPHVAAAAALILAVRRKLKAVDVKRIINQTADPLTASGQRDNLVGHGRLNVYQALREARRS